MWVVSGRAITETQVCLYSILICFLLFRDTSHFCVKEKVLSHKGERKLPGITPCYVPAVFLYPCACAHTSEQLYMERHTYYFQVLITHQAYHQGPSHTSFHFISIYFYEDTIIPILWTRKL